MLGCLCSARLGAAALQGTLRRPDKRHVLPVLHGSGWLAPQQLVTTVLRVRVIVDGRDEDGSVPPRLFHLAEGRQFLPVVPGGKWEGFGPALLRCRLPPHVPAHFLHVLQGSSGASQGSKDPCPLPGCETESQRSR